MRKPRVLFYYPQHFNRTAQGTNPFFDKLLETCDKYGVSYRLYEEPDGGTDKPHNPKARKADFFFWLVWFIRKIVKIFSKEDFYHREKYVAKIVNVLTLGYFKHPVYVTISESMLHLFAYLNDDAKVYDIQHGVQYKDFRCFYNETKFLNYHYDKSNIYFLNFGNGYRTALIDGAEEKMGHRVHVIGCPLDIRNIEVSYSKRSKKVVVALQMTDSSNAEELKYLKEQLDNLLNEFSGLEYEILLRHHPRYNDCIDISDLLQKYSFAKISNDALSDIAKSVLLHITIASTTAFDIAMYGVPSYFAGSFLTGNYLSFYDDYSYPLYKGMSIRDVLRRLSKQELWEADSAIIRDWYSSYYEPFAEAKFISLITN